MRLFKKRNFDSGPQLLSASPLSEETRAMIFHNQLTKTPVRADVFATPKKSAPSPFAMTKSLSSLTKKVGEKWDQIKRAHSSDLSSVLAERKRAPSPVKFEPRAQVPSESNSGHVKSLQTLFKSYARSSRSVSTSDMRASLGEVEGCVLEKSRSEGALKPSIEQLAQRKLHLARKIEDLERRNRMLEYYLKNPALLETSQGSSGAKMTIEEVNSAIKVTRTSLRRQDSFKYKRASRVSFESVGRKSYSSGSSYESVNDEFAHERCKLAEFDEMMKAVKITGDESGYDSDGSRAGATSPDSQVSSLAAKDLANYEGVDLSHYTATSLAQEIVLSEDDEDECAEAKATSCEVVGALTKDGRNISALEMKFEEKIRSSGMLKFQIRKRCVPSKDSRRAISLHTSNTHTVILEKGSSRLGFTIVGGTDSSKGKMGIYVKNILTGGQAEKNGVLRAKDEILAVNGTSLEGMTHGAALQIIRNAKRGKLVLYVSRRGS